MATINIIHRAAEKLRNGEWDVTETVVYSGNLTARGVAKANRVLDQERAYYRRIFSPGTISPSHSFNVQINGRSIEFDSEIQPDEGQTWADVANDLARAYA